MLKKDYVLNELNRIKAENSGFTWQDGAPVHYDGGYQYSKTINSEQNSTTDINKAAALIESYGGTCGAWYDGKKFYIETSYHENNLFQAMKNAGAALQLTIYDWKNDSYMKVPRSFYHFYKKH